MTKVGKKEYFDNNCRYLQEILLIILYITISCQKALLVWFDDKIVESEASIHRAGPPGKEYILYYRSLMVMVRLFLYV
jgi:hypothetical protein